MLKILIVDNLELARQGIKALIDNETEIEIIGFAKDGLEAIEFVQNSSIKPNIVLTDLFLPKIGGIKVTEEICRQFPEIKIIIVSDLKNKKVAICAIETGAYGYLLKNKLNNKNLTNAIWSAHYGYIQIDAEIINHSVLIESVERFDDSVTTGSFPSHNIVTDVAEKKEEHIVEDVWL